MSIKKRKYKALVKRYGDMPKMPLFILASILTLTLTAELLIQTNASLVKRPSLQRITITESR